VLKYFHQLLLEKMQLVCVRMKTIDLVVLGWENEEG
jgi:hypothetical protein